MIEVYILRIKFTRISLPSSNRSNDISTLKFKYVHSTFDVQNYTKLLLH